MFQQLFLNPFTADFLHRHMDSVFAPRLKQREFMPWVLDARDEEFIAGLQNAQADGDADAGRAAVPAVGAEAAPADGVSGRSSAVSMLRDATRKGGALTTQGLPSPSYVAEFWKFVRLEEEKSRQLFHAWPLVPLLPSVPINHRPAADGDASRSLGALWSPVMVPQRELARTDLLPMCALIPGAWAFADQLRAALEVLHFPVLDWTFLPSRTRIALASTPAHIQGLPRALLQAVPPLTRMGRIQMHSLSLPQNQVHAQFLCGFFADGFSRGDFTDGDKNAVRSLPIFEVLSSPNGHRPSPLPAVAGAGAAPADDRDQPDQAVPRMFTGLSDVGDDLGFVHVVERKQPAPYNDDEAKQEGGVQFVSLTAGQPRYIVSPDVYLPPAFFQCLIESVCAVHPFTVGSNEFVTGA